MTTKLVKDRRLKHWRQAGPITQDRVTVRKIVYESKNGSAGARYMEISLPRLKCLEKPCVE